MKTSLKNSNNYGKVCRYILVGFSFIWSELSWNHHNAIYNIKKMFKNVCQRFVKKKNVFYNYDK